MTNDAASRKTLGNTGLGYYQLRLSMIETQCNGKDINTFPFIKNNVVLNLVVTAILNVEIAQCLRLHLEYMHSCKIQCAVGV